MMLPSAVSDNRPSTVVIGVLGSTAPVLGLLSAIKPTHIQYLEITEDLVDSDAILACDAAIGILDGNLGISAALISAWQKAADHDLPRIVLAVNTEDGRADFDEALALAELVLNEDIVIRYYPIEDDVKAKYVGLLDVLVHEITQPNTESVTADQEHIDLTADDHDELVEALVHLDLNSEILQNHNSGLPISLPRLKQIWDTFDFVTVLPIDGQVSNSIIENWLITIRPTWLPVVTLGDSTDYINNVKLPLGIGIASGVARVWNVPSDSHLELHTDLDETLHLQPTEIQSGVFLDHRVRSDDIIRPLDTQFIVTAPAE